LSSTQLHRKQVIGDSEIILPVYAKYDYPADHRFELLFLQLGWGATPIPSPIRFDVALSLKDNIRAPSTLPEIKLNLISRLASVIHLYNLF
jgi:hypothetical protein